IAPSNPVVSIGTLLAIPGFGQALRETSAPVVGISPIIGGSPLRGMADSCLRAIGVESTATAVADHYGAREHGGILDAWLVHPGDAGAVGGVRVREAPLVMSDVDATAEMVRTAFDTAGLEVPR